MPSSSAQRIEAPSGPEADNPVSVISTRVPWRSAVRMPNNENSAARPPKMRSAPVPTGAIARITAIGTKPAAARK